MFLYFHSYLGQRGSNPDKHVALSSPRDGTLRQIKTLLGCRGEREEEGSEQEIKESGESFMSQGSVKMESFVPEINEMSENGVEQALNKLKRLIYHSPDMCTNITQTCSLQEVDK